MKISAHPLIVAAAFGLLGPAALADDDVGAELGGTWERADDGPPPADPLLDLGPSFEVIPVEDRVLVDVPAQGTLSWAREGELAARIELRVGDTTITRSLACDGDALHLTTVVDRDGQRLAWSSSYTRA